MLLGCIGALQEIISENGSFRCWEFSCSTSMPKWRTVSFVPGVTLNIGDSTSLRWSQIIFYVNNIFCNMKKSFSNLSLTYYHLEAVFLVSNSDKCDWKIVWTISYCHILHLDLGPTNFGPCFGHLGSDRPDLNFYRSYQLLQIELVNNWHPDKNITTFQFSK